jgi:hypothetical protein
LGVRIVKCNLVSPWGAKKYRDQAIDKDGCQKCGVE